MTVRFTSAARRAFSFLESIGFRLVRSEPARLQYESAQTFVAIEWDARSGELNLFIGLQPGKGGVRDSFSLRDMLAMENMDVLQRKLPFQAADETKLGPFLNKMAEDVRTFAPQALAGDRMFFRWLKTFRSAQAGAYMRDMELRHVRAEAGKAWQKRDLDKLIILYSSIEDQLSASEKAKLAFARKHRAR